MISESGGTLEKLQIPVWRWGWHGMRELGVLFMCGDIFVTQLMSAVLRQFSCPPTDNGKDQEQNEEQEEQEVLRQMED